MKRKAFALSWGRKIFFGMGWMLISIIGMTYLQSKILPQSSLEWFYYITSFIGHYGLIVSLLYFVFYYPIIWVLPHYYVSRFWSLFLIILAAALILFDSVLFMQYRMHASYFILELLFGEGTDSLKNLPTTTYALLLTGIFVVSIIIWMRGDWLWRTMQARFSNPVKNWYLVIILMCLGVSHGLHIYADAKELRNITRLSQLFPLSFPTTAKGILTNYGMLNTPQILDSKNDFKDFYYPTQAPVCKSNEKQNILFIIVDKLTPAELNPQETPAIEHFRTHGITYRKHLSGSNSSMGGLFSIFYSLPTTYLSAAKNNQTGPVLFDELKKRAYEIGVFSSLPIEKTELAQTVFLNVPITESEGNSLADKNMQTTESWKQWLNSTQSPDATKPFFSTIVYDLPAPIVPIAPLPTTEQPTAEIIKSPLAQVDDMIESIVSDLYKKNLLSSTIIFITANYASDENKKEIDLKQLKVPLIGLFPEQKKGEVNNLTTHYDLVPTLMAKAWGCNNSFNDYSYGSSLFSPAEKKWIIIGSDEKFGVLDFQNGLITSIEASGKYHVTDLELRPVVKSKTSESVIFEVLKNLTRFYKK